MININNNINLDIYFYKQYRNLKLSLEAARAKLKVLERELNILVYADGPKDIKAVDPSEIKASFSPMPLMERYERIATLSTDVANTKLFIAELEKQLAILAEVAEDMAATFDDLELAVFNLRFIKGMKLIEIAQELGYSYAWIRETNSNLTKKLGCNAPKNKNLQKTYINLKKPMI